MDSRLLAVLLAPVLLTVRWVWKTFIAHHPLDNVQGPPAPSFSAGEKRNSDCPSPPDRAIILGHGKIIFSPWRARLFQEEIVDKYGRIVLLKGAWGVSVWSSNGEASRLTC